MLLSSVEHAGHLRLARALAHEGWSVDLMPVLADGRLDLAAAAGSMGPDVALVSLMAANNETGALMPVNEVAALARAAGAAVHVDATQMIGKLPFSFAASGADAVSLSAHKFHGPKGVGALLLRQGTPLHGAHARQPGARAGAVARRICPASPAWRRRLNCWPTCRPRPRARGRLRDALERGLSALPGLHIWSRQVPRLPGHQLPAVWPAGRRGRAAAAGRPGRRRIVGRGLLVRAAANRRTC